MTFEKWEKASEPFMTALSFVFLAVYAWMVLAQPYSVLATVGNVVMDSTWIIFAIDYIITLILVPNKGRWFVMHLFDLVVVTLPMFRPLRTVFAFTPLRALRKANSQTFRARIITYTVAVSVMVFFVGSLALLDAERNAPGATIHTFPEALWCMWVSMTSVGYGDYSPVSAEGRCIAALMMFAGIILNGIICALLSSWLIQEESIRKNREDRLTKERIAKIHGHMDEISKDLRDIKRELAEAQKARDEQEGKLDEDDDDEDAYDDEEDELEETLTEESGAHTGDTTTVLRPGDIARYAKQEQARKEREKAERRRQHERDEEAEHNAFISDTLSDEPDPDSGYSQLASPSVRRMGWFFGMPTGKPTPDPKAERLTGEKRSAPYHTGKVGVFRADSGHGTPRHEAPRHDGGHEDSGSGE
ncbi:MAG: ion transporter [Bifidobacteriaceae bacterium]|nr:ion transporter [Bifidobacteriaceae bacterium]